MNSRSHKALYPEDFGMLDPFAIVYQARDVAGRGISNSQLITGMGMRWFNGKKLSLRMNIRRAWI